MILSWTSAASDVYKRQAPGRVRTSVSTRVHVRICPVADTYLHGCRCVSARLHVRIYPAAGMYLRGCRNVSAPDVRHRLSPYELLERLYLVVQYQFLRKSCLLQ